MACPRQFINTVKLRGSTIDLAPVPRGDASKCYLRFVKISANCRINDIAVPSHPLFLDEQYRAGDAERRGPQHCNSVVQGGGLLHEVPNIATHEKKLRVIHTAYDVTDDGCEYPCRSRHAKVGRLLGEKARLGEL